MTLNELKNYFPNQRFVIKFHSDNGWEETEIFELIIIEVKNNKVSCRYNYLYVDGVKVEEKVSRGVVEYDIDVMNELVEDCWYKKDGWSFISWEPVIPKNIFPKDLFEV